MRTSDQSFLSKMAFNDSDRKTSLHNDVCLYLTQEQKRKKIVELFHSDFFKKSNGCETGYYLSLPLSREGSSSILGYADLIVWAFDHADETLGDDCEVEVLIEVKSRKTQVTDIIQQLLTYEDITRRRYKQLLATAYPLNKIEIESLQKHGIKSIYVSPKDVKAFMENGGPP